jgi:hypothetical protein
LVDSRIVKSGVDVKRAISDCDLRLAEIDLEKGRCLERPKIIVTHDVVCIGVEYIIIGGDGWDTCLDGADKGEKYGK